MRTHLLRTFYPSSAIEPDTGWAANDDNGESGDVPRTTGSPKTLVIVAKAADESANDESDDYYLGGYAGI
ncbi:MAG TPA: hypothetical protein VGO25_12225 [Rhodanobacteraceae bacterium]|jgi:hypothetical protein|nr:hypothetical protein [Rhodanobacteraceae bacterium]